MENKNDEKAFGILEKAVLKAQESLEKTKYFQPFIMLLNDTGKVEVFENDIKDSLKSYTALEEILKESVNIEDVDILLLAVDTEIPDNFAKDIPNAIRLHLEEKSQIEKKIAARFIYVPYELCQVPNNEMYVKLHAPIAVGFPAEYIIR